jgi:hypothetical protein
MKPLFINMLLLFIATLSFAQIPNYVPTNGLVGWWPFNGNANDESGNGNNGTVNGATLTADRFGIVDKAYYFSSIGCATFIDAQINTASISGGLTISFWVNRTNNGCIGPRIMKFYAPADGPGTHVFDWPNNSNNPSMAFVTSTSTSPFYQYNNIPNNSWAHIIYTNNGSTAKLYQDGLLLSSNNSTGTVTLASNANFGRMSNPAYDAFNGQLDDIGIWNRALSQCEITDLYNAVVGSSATTKKITQASCNSFTLNNQTYTQSGTYIQTLVNAAGCDSTIILYLTINRPTTNTITQSSCNSYTLNNQTYTQSDTYTLNLTNAAGCDSIVTLNLTINNSPSASGSSTGATFHGATDGSVNLTVSGGASPYSFNWSNGANTEDLNAVAAGSYTVTITDANNCSSTTSVTVNQPPLALFNSPESIITSALYPNPATAQTRLDLQLNQAQDFEIAVYNNLGQRIFNKNFSNTKELSENIDMRSWPAGQYFVEIKLPNGTETKKLIKE